MTTKPVLGISGCLTGSAVRFDGGHKRMSFVMDELAQWVNFRPRLSGNGHRPADASPCAAFDFDHQRNADAL